MADQSALLPGEEFEIDLRALVGRLRRAWIKLLACGVLAMGLAAGWGWWKGPVYMARMQILETRTDEMAALGGLSSIKNLVGQGAGDDLGSLELFRALLGSRIVAEKVLREEVRNPKTDSVMQLYKTIGLDTSNAWRWDLFAEKFTKQVAVKPVGGGVYELSCAAGKPWMAQIILTRFYDVAMSELRTASKERFTTTLASLERAAESAGDKRRAAVEQLAIFNARNMAITSPELFIQRSQLESEAKIKEQMYLVARQELETMRLQREKFVLPAVVISPAVMPVRPSKPKWEMLLAAGFLAGVLVGAGIELSRKSEASTRA